MGVFQIDWQRYRLVDLSYEVVPGASAERYLELERGLLADNAYMHHVRTHTHVGTHVEVDAHFFEGGRDVLGYSLQDFLGRGLLLDVPDASATPLITAAVLDAQLGARIGERDIVICRNSDPESLAGRRVAPSLTPEAGEWLAAHRVIMLGIDTHFRLGVDVPHGRAFHQAFMGAGGTLVEFLDHLDELRRPEFFFMALPYKARQMDSSWARAIAVEEL